MSSEVTELRHSTSNAYKSYLNNQIKPRWDDYPLSKVQPFAVKQWLKGLRERKGSPTISCECFGIEAIDWEPSFKFTHVELADVYALKGMFQEAASEWARVEVLGGDTVTPEQLAAVHDTVGYKRSQELFIERQIASSKRKYRSPMNIALAYARLGNAEQVLTWLEEAYRQRAPGLSGLKVEPLFDFLRGNPRFQDLLRRMNFPD